MFPAVFLDRDGVLIENRPDYVRDWSQVEVFPEAIHALSLPAVRNFKIIIVTNQSAVGRGLITLETAVSINDQLVNLIRQQGGRIDGVYICPHKPDNGCDCRKPKPGLFLQAATELSLNLQQSWVIGDAWTDLQAGQAAGLRQTVLVRSGRGVAQSLLPPPKDISGYLVFDNLFQAISIIFNSNKSS